MFVEHQDNCLLRHRSLITTSFHVDNSSQECGDEVDGNLPSTTQLTTRNISTEEAEDKKPRSTRQISLPAENGLSRQDKLVSPTVPLYRGHSLPSSVITYPPNCFQAFDTYPDVAQQMPEGQPDVRKFESEGSLKSIPEESRSSYGKPAIKRRYSQIEMDVKEGNAVKEIIANLELLCSNKDDTAFDRKSEALCLIRRLTLIQELEHNISIPGDCINIRASKGGWAFARIQIGEEDTGKQINFANWCPHFANEGEFLVSVLFPHRCSLFRRTVAVEMLTIPQELVDEEYPQFHGRAHMSPFILIDNLLKETFDKEVVIKFPFPQDIENRYERLYVTGCFMRNEKWQTDDFSGNCVVYGNHIYYFSKLFSPVGMGGCGEGNRNPPMTDVFFTENSSVETARGLPNPEVPFQRLLETGVYAMANFRSGEPVLVADVRLLRDQHEHRVLKLWHNGNIMRIHGMRENDVILAELLGDLEILRKENYPKLLEGGILKFDFPSCEDQMRDNNKYALTLKVKDGAVTRSAEILFKIHGVEGIEFVFPLTLPYGVYEMAPHLRDLPDVERVPVVHFLPAVFVRRILEGLGVHWYTFMTNIGLDTTTEDAILKTHTEHIFREVYSSLMKDPYRQQVFFTNMFGLCQVEVDLESGPNSYRPESEDYVSFRNFSNKWLRDCHPNIDHNMANRIFGRAMISAGLAEHFANISCLRPGAFNFVVEQLESTPISVDSIEHSLFPLLQRRAEDFEANSPEMVAHDQLRIDLNHFLGLA